MRTGVGKILPAIVRVAAVAAISLLAACAGTPGAPPVQLAQTTTSHVDPKTGDGIGGTGISSQSVVARTRGDGMGGTGIIGTISGFGSIIVNGLELEYDRATAVETDQGPGALEDLKIGQVIQGIAQKRGDKFYLDTLEMQHAVTGPIERIDHAAQTLTVLGQNIKANLGSDKTSIDAFKTLTTGDMVSISGLRQSDGTIMATRVDQQPADGRLIVRGSAADVTAQGLKVGGLEIALSAGNTRTPVTNGGRVFASGRMVDGKFVADVVVGSAPLPFGDNVNDVSIEAYLPNTAATPLVIEGMNIESATLPADATVGDRLVISGRISGANTISTTSIEKIRTFVTILRARGSLRPAQVRPDNNRRPERMVAPPRERPNVERPNLPDKPTRPEREKPEGIPMV